MAAQFMLWVAHTREGFSHQNLTVDLIFHLPSWKDLTQVISLPTIKLLLA